MASVKRSEQHIRAHMVVEHTTLLGAVHDALVRLRSLEHVVDPSTHAQALRNDVVEEWRRLYPD